MLASTTTHAISTALIKQRTRNACETWLTRTFVHRLSCLGINVFVHGRGDGTQMAVHEDALPITLGNVVSFVPNANVRHFGVALVPPVPATAVIVGVGELV